MTVAQRGWPAEQSIGVGYSGRVKVSRISKIAGLSFAGFVVAAIAADKVNLNPIASQVAGYVGAFAGTLAARLGKKPDEPPEQNPKDPKQH